MVMCLLCGCQADLSSNVQDDPAAFYGVSSQYESSENMTITCSTKVCSFGKQVVEKVEVRMDSLWLTLRLYRIFFMDVNVCCVVLYHWDQTMKWSLQKKK